MSTVKATTPGVFHRRPHPRSDPYVREGSSVSVGQTVALIEVTKTYSEIKADHAGTARRFLLHDGEEVRSGQDLLEIEDV